MSNQSKVLIVVDAQNDFITGALGSEAAQKAMPYIVEKLKEYENEVVFFTQDTHGEDYLKTQEGKYLPVPHCIKGTEGWCVSETLLEVVEPDEYIEKETFGSDLLPTILYNEMPIESIELVGFCTDICVVSNALILKAFFPEIPIKVYAPGCAGTSEENHLAALAVMRSCQIEVYEFPDARKEMNF